MGICKAPNCLAASSAEQDLQNTIAHRNKDYNQFNATLTNNDDQQKSWQVHQMHCCHDRLEERGMERGSASRSSLKGRERAIVNQKNIGTL